MRKFIGLALAASIGVAAVSMSAPAKAGVAIGLSVPLPGVVAAPAVIAPWPYYYAGPRYYYPGVVRYGYGVPYGYRYGYRPGYVRLHARGWR